MGGVLAIITFIFGPGVVFTWLTGEQLYDAKRSSDADKKQLEVEEVIEAESHLAKYNLERQKQLDDLRVEDFDRWIAELRKVLGRSSVDSMMRRYSRNLNFFVNEVKKAVAEKEGWELYRDPRNLSPWDPRREEFFGKIEQKG